MSYLEQHLSPDTLYVHVPARGWNEANNPRGRDCLSGCKGRETEFEISIDLVDYCG